MDLPQDKNSLCIFCYHRANTFDLSENCDGFSESDFLKLFSTYIHLEKECYEKVPVAQLMFCEKCTEIITSFCECSSKMELPCLEMNSQVQKLMQRMMDADKRQFEVSLFGRQFESSVHEDIMKMRKELIFHCK